MRHLDLFSGIGGFALAVEEAWPDAEHVFCDIEPFSQAILKKHWPEAKIYGDIKELKGEEIGTVDLVTGGFPCQPFSSAGNRRGTEDDRHLWPEMLRVIRETSPRWVIGENVGGLLTWNGGMVLDEVFADLEAEGYEVWAFVIPACAVNAPHRRDRVWIVAHSKSVRDRGNTRELSQENERQEAKRQKKRPCKPIESSEVRDATNPDSRRLRRYERQSAQKMPTTACSWEKNWLEVAARLCTLDDGLPNGLARPRGWRNAALKGAGNAIVPQVAGVIMRHIKAIEK